ncbi:MAG TPA: cysteine desulfurase family protein [Planctomycetota bacterium]|nr:cysteine desulfurase family protein [Planctomycetota bacterium]
MTPDPRYFDYAASCPPFPEALARQSDVAAELYASPSSTHAHGRRAAARLEEERRAFLALAGRPDATLVLTSGATEANNLVLRGALEAAPEGRLLLAADVHPSAWFARAKYGRRVDVLETGPDGRISPARLSAAITKKTALVSVVRANNETGIVQDLPALADVCREKGVPLHADEVQALGHLPPVEGATYATFSAHKFGGPRGVGGVIARGSVLPPQVEGGGQEAGARGGTQNVAGLAGAVVALRLSLAVDAPRLRRLARRLQDAAAALPGARLNSDPERGLPGFVSVSFGDLVGEELVAELDLRGFAVSAGSACGSGRMQPSRVVLAMGRSTAEGLGTLRISMGRGTTEEAVDDLAAALREAVQKLRALR